MSVKADDYDKVCVLEITGDFSGENARAAAAGLDERLKGRRIVDVVVNMAKCPFVDSEGLETLLNMKRQCEDMFGQMKLACMEENCRTIMQITRLEHRFETHDDLAAALKTMR